MVLTWGSGSSCRLTGCWQHSFLCLSGTEGPVFLQSHQLWTALLLGAAHSSLPRGPHRQFTSGLLAFFQASQDVPHCDYFKVVCFLIIENIRTNFTLEKAGRQETIVLEFCQWCDLEKAGLVSLRSGLTGQKSCAKLRPSSQEHLIPEHHHTPLPNLCTGVLGATGWTPTQERTYGWSGYSSLGLQTQNSASGPLLDGSRFIDTIDFMFICKGTEYEMTK